jgi:hypothetical protein
VKLQNSGNSYDVPCYISDVVLDDWHVKMTDNKMNKGFDMLTRLSLLGLLLAGVLSLSSCAVYTPDGAVIVDPGSYHDHGQGQFCPPGQAKKGNC